jgi:SAM-dependent methyltransferase
MSACATDVIAEMAALSRQLSPEATRYWRSHEPRFRYFLQTLATLRPPGGFPRILDVGMSFQTLILRRVCPTARIDCLGFAADDRYQPGGESTFLPFDLNDLAALAGRAPPAPGYELIVCMEVLEHLYTPPALILDYLGRCLAPGGLLLVTTPNAAWLKNRIKLCWGRNPFELLNADRQRMGHIREYTARELADAFAATGLAPVRRERRGLYHFSSPKDRFYNRLANVLHPSLRRTLVAVYRRP